MTHQKELELRNKLDVALFGIDTFIHTAEANLKFCEEMGQTGSSIKPLLDFIKDIQSRLKEMP